MTRLSLITLTLFILMSGLAHAKWEIIADNDDSGVTVYVDPDTIRRKGDLVKIWGLYDFKTAQIKKGLSHLSTKVQKEYNCAEERHRLISFTQFSGNMGEGNVVDSDSTEYKWEPVEPDSIGQRIWNLTCVKK